MALLQSSFNQVRTLFKYKIVATELAPHQEFPILAATSVPVLFMAPTVSGRMDTFFLHNSYNQKEKGQSLCVYNLFVNGPNCFLNNSYRPKEKGPSLCFYKFFMTRLSSPENRTKLSITRLWLIQSHENGLNLFLKRFLQTRGQDQHINVISIDPTVSGELTK